MKLAHVQFYLRIVSDLCEVLVDIKYLVEMGHIAWCVSVLLWALYFTLTELRQSTCRYCYMEMKVDTDRGDMSGHF